jgi:tetratricopeptide (TPR) repeat protein
MLFLSDVHVRRAQANARENPATALSEAKSAGALNPWSIEPHWLRAGALERLGRRREARAQLDKALDMEPQNFGTLGLLGDFEARGGHTSAAQAFYRRALALNPLDVGLRKLARGEFGSH